MYKKLIILSVIVIPLPCSAGLGDYISAWWHNRAIPSSVLQPHIPLAPQQLAGVAGGVSSNNLLETVKEARAAVKDVLDHPEAVEEASKSVSHGFTRGLFTGPASAARDGALYVKDTAVEHPYIAGLALTAGVAGAAYYKFRPLTEEETQKAQIEKDKRQSLIRQAASVVKADMYAEDYRTCLNRHAYDHGASCDEKIQRCHSPARKLAMEAPKRAKKITQAYREYA